MTGAGATTARMRVGLDIGGTKILGVAVDDDGEVLAQERAATELGPEGVARSAAAVVEALRARTGRPIAGPVGVGIPGLVDTERGAVAHAVNLGLADWYPLADLLGEALAESLAESLSDSPADRPVVVENDLNVATLGASWLAGVDDLVYLGLGTGLASGVVLDGRLRRGLHGAAGEVGHIPVGGFGTEDTVCQCGQRGCLELVASGTALERAWPVAEGHAAAAVFEAAAAGDPAAVRVRDRFAAGVAAGVRLLALAVDPAVVVLGGGVAQIGEPLRDAVAAALRAQAVGSPFLASLDLAGRLRVVPADRPVAALGAAMIGTMLREPPWK